MNGEVVHRREKAPVVASLVAAPEEATMKHSFSTKALLASTLPTPGGRALSHQSGEHAGQVALVHEAAGQRNFRDRNDRFGQQCLDLLDAIALPPLMRCGSRGEAEGPCEMSAREPAVLRDILQRYVLGAIGCHELPGTRRLALRQPSAKSNAAGLVPP